MQPNAEVHVKAVSSLFQVFEEMCEGAIAVDRDTRVVWLNEKYRTLLGIAPEEAVVGRDIEEIIPESLMRQVVHTGKPILLDIMRVGSNQFVVTRLPLRDEAGATIGAIGFVLYDSLEYLRPLINKFDRLCQKLSAAEAELAAARRTRYSIGNIVGVSKEIVELRRLARKLAQSSSPALLLGETGTGKELLAQSIHAASSRSKRPFVAVNMAAMPETLIEAEFFGVAPGAYTGADRRGRKGKLEIADGGTLLLDEIGDLPRQLQVKLLRVLEEREFEPVGSNDVRRIDVRIIAATSRDLDELVASGDFRKDLFYRLNVLPLRLPSLRERKEDIRPLAEFLLERICQASGSRLRDIDPRALTRLEAYDWPGNVRELKNILERACFVSDADVLGVLDFERLLPAAAAQKTPSAESTEPSLPRRVAQLEHDLIINALAQSNGQKSSAARLLGISRSTLYEKLREHGLSDKSTDGD
ncbi:MAG: AAA domain-containing protein [Hyphomicrobiaceae bacterium]|nr:MAG: AAA domain-containing protein [Hyphomicrobiaceae bacterium]